MEVSNYYVLAFTEQPLMVELVPGYGVQCNKGNKSSTIQIQSFYITFYREVRKYLHYFL